MKPTGLKAMLPELTEAQHKWLQGYIAEQRSEAQKQIFEWHERLKWTLFIDPSSSSCGNCGASADPMEKGHQTRLGWGEHNGEIGCLHGWKYVASNYADMDEILKDMRPDLELASAFPALLPAATLKRKAES